MHCSFPCLLSHTRILGYSCIWSLSFQRIPVAFYCLFRSKWGKISFLWLVYLQTYAVCLTLHLIHTHWVILRMLMLSGDVEPNSGPDTLTLLILGFLDPCSTGGGSKCPPPLSRQYCRYENETWYNSVQ